MLSSSSTRQQHDDDDDLPDEKNRMTDTQLRKKKNADAQAAFRARRANYIASLEETVTSLESVVLQLQDSCREAKAESNDLRQENARLRREGQEREKFWRQLWINKGSAGGRDSLPPLPTAFFPASAATRPQPSTSTSQVAPVSPTHYTQQDAYSSYPTDATYATTFMNQPMPTASSAGGQPSQQGAKYASYASYGMPGPSRADSGWPPGVGQSSSSGGDSGPPENGSASHSPAYVQSPTLMSPALSYNMAQYRGVEEQKMNVTGLDSAQYVFGSGGTSQNISQPSTPTSTSSTSPYHQVSGYADPSTMPHDRSMDYAPYHRRQPGPDMTLHGGIADISSMTARSFPQMPTTRRAHSGPSGVPEYHTAAEPPMNTEDVKPATRARAAGSESQSRSPSPSEPPISGTLAVIKAQAFGALRRNRARTKRSSGAAKAAIQALEARGSSMGVGVKRPRLHSDDEDTKGR